MRKLMTLLVAALLVQTAGAVRAADEDIFSFVLKPNVLILIDGSASMIATDGGVHPALYGVDLDGNGNALCPGNECVADLDVDGIDDTRNDAALQVVLDLLDANGDGVVNAADEDTLKMRLGLMYWTAAGTDPVARPGRADNRPRAELEFDFPVIAPLGTSYADIKKAIVDPIIALTPDINIVVGDLRGCSAAGSEDTAPCNAVNPAVGFKLNDTPMGDVLEYVEHYFIPEQLANDPEGSCRQNFIILISDGSYNGYAVPSTITASVYNNGTPKAHGLGVPDGFKDRYNNVIPVPSLFPEPNWHAKTFVVGFNGGDVAANDATAAAGGTGTAFFESTVGGLKTALQDALSQIQVEVIALAPPPLVVPTARVGANSALYLASLIPGDTPFWEGKLTAYPLQADGTIQTDVDGKIIAIPLWEAHTVLTGVDEKDRNVKTVVSGTTVEDFKNASIPLKTALNVTTDLDGNSIVNANDANWLIDYVRGDNGTNPAWKLADIFHSVPVLVGPSSITFVDLDLNRVVDPAFDTFRTTFQTRDQVLYVGSNGGMLQAFHAGAWTGSDYDNGTGAERWGFIPPDLLPKLQNMVGQHTHYVDGPPKAADVWLDGISNVVSGGKGKGKGAAVADNVKTADEWHTVLITGERKGGNTYFAVDVTDPGTNAPIYLWSFTDPNLGQTWSRPEVGKVKLNVDSGVTDCQLLEDQGLTSASCIERWVAFVGGGYSTGSGGPAVFTYQFVDKDSVTLTRDFTKQVAAGALAFLDLKLASTVPGATPPASCVADCFAYDPNGASDPASIPPADLGYVGNLNSGNYGGGTAFTSLNLLSSGGGGGDVGKAFFVIDMNTGAKLWEFTVADDATMDRVPASPILVDTDGDGFVDRVYIGDVAGNIWRFDLQEYGITAGLGTLVTSGWTGSKLFAATTGRPFFGKMAVAIDVYGNFWVYGGTGDVNDPMNKTTQDRFYAIKEAYPVATGTPPPTVPAVLTDADLADTGGVNTLNPNDPVFNATEGWFLPLPAGGEKVLSDAEVFAGVVLFTAFTPQTATCTVKLGTSQLYAISYLTGGGATDYDQFKQGVDGLAKTHGQMSGLATRPVISVGTNLLTGVAGGDVVIFVCTSSDECGNPPAPQPGTLRWVDYWRDM